MTRNEVDAVLERVQAVSKWLSKNKNQYRCASDTIRAYSKFYSCRDIESLEVLDLHLTKCEILLGLRKVEDLQEVVLFK